jgi:hypothetical protein
MKRLPLFLILIAAGLPLPASGWNLGDHREMARQALADVAADWGLDRPVEVRPLASFLGKLKALRPEIADQWQFSHYLKINPKIDIGTFVSLRHPEEAPGGAKTLAPAEILSLYATDADDGRDQDLFVRDGHGNPKPMFPDQKWFGAIQGPNSQAFRHMEKPPFSLRHPVATFGFPLRSIGEASERTEIYFQLSQLAFALGEDYWGWRFLAGGLHYLQDLHQPYHAGQIAPTLLKQGLGVLLSWGWDEKGFMWSFVHVVSNSHRFFETYVDSPQGRDDGGKEKALSALRGADVPPLLPVSRADLARNVRDASVLLYPKLSESVAAMTGEALTGREEFYSDGDKSDKNSDPKDFIRETPEFEDANRRVFEIVTDRFRSAGAATRAYVKAAIGARSEGAPPADILRRLDDRLGPSLTKDETDP